jgi:hypothetical protein
MTPEALADELLQAVRTHLAGLVPKLAGAERYNLQVAIKALEIAARETALGPAAAQAEQVRLRTLLNTDAELPQLRSGLCARLREGRIAPDDPALLAHLRASTRAALDIDNPDFPFGAPP